MAISLMLSDLLGLCCVHMYVPQWVWTCGRVLCACVPPWVWTCGSYVLATGVDLWVLYMCMCPSMGVDLWVLCHVSLRGCGLVGPVCMLSLLGYYALVCPYGCGLDPAPQHHHSSIDPPPPPPVWLDVCCSINSL